MRTKPRTRTGSFWPKLVLMLAPILVLEGVLALTEPLWNQASEYAPDFVLERQGGLLEIQSRLLERAGTEEGILASERMYAWDPVLFWKLRPNLSIAARNYLVPEEWGISTPFHISTNEAGLRAGDHGAGAGDATSDGARGSKAGDLTPPDAPTIVCMGNSCTFGWGVEADETYSSHLEEIMRSRSGRRDIRVVNAGTPGYTTFQGRRFLEQRLPAATDASGSRGASRSAHDLYGAGTIDYAVFSYGFNDSRKATRSDAALAESQRTLLHRTTKLLERLRTYRFLRSVLPENAVPRNRDRETPRVSPEEYGANLRALIKAARARDIVPVVLTLVMPREYNEAARAAAASEGALLVDPVPTLVSLQSNVAEEAVPAPFRTYHDKARGNDPRMLFFADPVHLNSFGNWIVATRLAEALGSVDPSLMMQ
ncbi:MAG: hypothetical protein HKN20_12945 [Gemmatimonadetes bacterium]|nr:hypothetical protein [Gemmatimonadota bacterium]